MSGIVKFLSDDPQSTKAWAKGSEGERRLAAHLARSVGEQAVLLHDRLIPGTRSNIDHLVIAATGVWVIDAKSYKGKVEQRDVGGWLRSDKRLFVNGRDRSALIAGLNKQTVAVLSALQGMTISASVMPVICFVDSEWPLLAKPFQQEGVLVTRPKMLSAVVSKPGTLNDMERTLIAERLSAGLPPAV
jgi:hypothetical protein